MAWVDPSSLAATLDAVGDALLRGEPLAADDRLEAARWIAGRQGLPGSYAGMPAPTEGDYREGVRLFTGEPLRTGAGVGHVLGEEACRTLLRLRVRDRAVRDALARAGEEMTRRLASGRERTTGMYCCGKCTAALWRTLAAGGFRDQETLLAAGLRSLRAHRLDDGTWRRFPFWYTVLALAEMDLPGAVAEMRHAAGRLERAARRRPTGETVDARRRLVAERVLARV